MTASLVERLACNDSTLPGLLELMREMQETLPAQEVCLLLKEVMSHSPTIRSSYDSISTAIRLNEVLERCDLETLRQVFQDKQNQRALQQIKLLQKVSPLYSEKGERLRQFI